MQNQHDKKGYEKEEYANQKISEQEIIVEYKITNITNKENNY